MTNCIKVNWLPWDPSCPQLGLASNGRMMLNSSLQLPLCPERPAAWISHPETLGGPLGTSATSAALDIPKHQLASPGPWDDVITQGPVEGWTQGPTQLG